jgi:hypothetical protein
MDQHRDSKSRSLEAEFKNYNATTLSSNVIESGKGVTSSKQYINSIEGNSSSSSDQRPLFGYGPGIPAYELDIRREQGMEETEISKELYAIATQTAAGVMRAHIGG